MKKIYAIKMTVSLATKASVLNVHVANEDLKAGIDLAINRGLQHDGATHVKDLARTIGRSGILEGGGEGLWHRDSCYLEGHGEGLGAASIEITRNIELS